MESLERAGLGALILFLMVFSGAFAEEPGDDYSRLMTLRPTLPGLVLEGVALERDVIKIELQSGTFYPLAEIQGRVLGGVFLGKGRLELAPPDAGEKNYLAFRTRDKAAETFSDSFESAVFLFTDQTWDEIKASGRPGSQGGDPAAVYEKFLQAEKKDLEVNLHLRLLADLLDAAPPEWGCFFVGVEGKRLARGLAGFDPRGLPASGFDTMFGTETTCLIDLQDENAPFWYSRAPLGKASPSLYQAEVEAAHYSIETAIAKNLDFEGKTTITLRTGQGGMRVIPFTLTPKLRLSSAVFQDQGEAGVAVPFIQGEESKIWEDEGCAVVLPEPLKKGIGATLTLTYAGDEIMGIAGGDNYAVGERASWYPNLGTFTGTASFDLQFRVPAGKQVISVGRRVSSTKEGKVAVHTFKTDQPIRVAGFNYGIFSELEREDKESGVTFRVYTNKNDTDLARVLMESGFVTGNISTGAFQEDSLADAINSTRLGKIYFGPLGADEISITQQPFWNSGQSWPSLIFLPILAFMSSTHRAELGISGANEFSYTVGYHELFHQWWGHKVGWATYRDQWLSEGLAEFSAGLALQAVDGKDRYQKYLDRGVRDILQGGPGMVSPAEAGPINLGFRLETPRSPGAYQAQVYKKGSFVIHMLRSMLYDGKDKNPEAKFMALLQDFASSWAGKAPTTEDFRQVVARHFTGPQFGDMKWFFDQWVYGTTIPQLSQKFEVRDQGDGNYLVTGQLALEGVPEEFRAFVPLYVEMDKGHYFRLGQAVVQGTKPAPANFPLKLPKPPRRVVANVYHDLLADERN